MVCRQCGAGHHSEACPQPITAAAMLSPRSEPELTLNQTTPESTTVDGAAASRAKPASRLITFPGVTHRTVPPWRQELRARVREVQERKAQEAAAETDVEGAILQTADVGNLSSSQLELLPQAEAVDVNPLVVAALKRIERAHHSTLEDVQPSYPQRLSAAAGATDQGGFRSEVRPDNNSSGFPSPTLLFDTNDRQSTDSQVTAAGDHGVTVTTVSVSEALPQNEIERPLERTVNLSVVPPATIVAETNPLPTTEVSLTKPKPKRVISDDATDPALNYLDLVGVAYADAVDSENRAPLFFRLLAGIIDILFVGFLTVPFAAVVELRNDSWHEPRVAIFMASAAVVVMFIYLTVATALTGKTLGVKILSLRVIDTRTRLIPTGQQAAGRAIVYIFSLATAGVGFLLALARGEGKTLHDRLSHTTVVRD